MSFSPFLRKNLYILVFFYCFWQRVFALFTIFYGVVLGIIYTDAIVCIVSIGETGEK